MSKNIEEAMFYLDKIEAELNKMAEAIGHPSMEEFFEEKAQLAA